MAASSTAAQVAAVVVLLLGGAAVAHGDADEAEVVGVLGVGGEVFVLLDEPGEGPVYDVCAVREPRTCAAVPATAQTTQVSLPSEFGGAVVFVGLRDGGPSPGDRIELDGVAVEPSWARPDVLGYDVAGFRVDAVRDVYCLRVFGAAPPVQHIGVAGRDVAGARC